jgi:hypothetical protein
MSHDCVARINALLAERNTVIAQAISFGPPRELIQIATAKADHKVRGKPALFFASHCPFCGAKLETGEAPQ